MDGLQILTSLHDELPDAIRSHIPVSARPLSISPWLAMSLLQKAVRRGQREQSLRAAATLLLTSPDRLWRRCAVIAFEDVGTADNETVSLVTASLAGKTF